ncbi:MAG: DUF3501 family protein [Polyangiaceae bacterium]
MSQVKRGELLGLAEYEQIREPFRQRIMAMKQVRRVALGSNMTVVFENHDTALYQIQEMLRTERITAAKAIEHELETYNELVPGPHELSATVFIEYPEREQRERMLAALAGVESAFFVRVAGERLAVLPDTRGTETDRTIAVQYVKFPLSASAEAALRRGESDISLGVEHEAYRVEVVLSRATLSSLSDDFA